MRIETKYIADDGAEFSTPHECKIHEDTIKKEERKALQNYILFFGNYGAPMSYSPYHDPTYVYVKLIPEDNNTIRPIWDEVLSEALSSAIQHQCIRGWYIKDENGKWHSLRDLQMELKKTETTIQKIVKHSADLF